MGELAARLGLHAAVDRMVVDHAITIDQIVRLVQAYDPDRAIPRRPPAPPSPGPDDAVHPDRTDGRQPDEAGATQMFDRASTPDEPGSAAVQRSDVEAGATDDDEPDSEADGHAEAVDQGDPTPEPDEGSPSRRQPAEGWADDAAVLLGRDVPIPSASEALGVMSDSAATEPIDAARRIRALWLAKQAADLAIGNGNDPDGITDDAIRLALLPVVKSFPRDADKYPPERYRIAAAADKQAAEHMQAADDAQAAVNMQAAEHLLALISDIETAEDFRQRFASVAAAYLRADVAWAAAAECHDSTMYVDITQKGQTDTDVAAVMTTSLEIPLPPDLTLADLRLRMHPDNWPRCLPTFWCEMRRCPGDADPDVVDVEFVRQEFVGDFDPPTEPPTPCQTADAWFQPILRFRHRDLPDSDHPDGFELQFTLASDPIPGAIQGNPSQDDRFLVDAGAMNVRIRDETILVRTSKVLLLSPPISAIGLTILACALGYGDMGTAMLAKALE